MTKTEQKKIRRQILSIMDDNQEWLKDDNKVTIIQNLGAQLAIDSTSMVKLGNWEDFRRSDFLYLLSEGYTSNQIAKAYGAGQRTFLHWKKNQGFLKKHKSEILYEFADEISDIKKKNEKQAIRLKLATIDTMGRNHNDPL